MSDFAAASRRFRQIGTFTIFAVFFLILVGGIVRASGAGMGCPDWPTCFGQFVPPTSASQLPQDYQTFYPEGADTTFNVVKTWTEYLNRLTGVAIGLLILLTVIYSVPFLKHDKTIFYLSLLVFLLVGFQGWLGALVVKSNLHPVMITVHMLVALLIVALLIYVITRSQREKIAQMDLSGLSERFSTVVIAAMGLTLIQVAMGTQVREAVDHIAVAFNHDYRHLWRETFPVIFYVHRSFSALILFTNLWLAWQIVQRVDRSHLLFRCAIALVGLILFAIVSGVTMDRFGIPAAAQPLHLLLASLIFGLQSFIYITVGYAHNRGIMDD